MSVRELVDFVLILFLFVEGRGWKVGYEGEKLSSREKYRGDKIS